MKTKLDREAAALHLERAAKQVREGNLDWYALSCKFTTGGRLTIHTLGAPKRPTGLS